MLVDCYAQRLLNPYRGMVHVIRYAAAEAVTSDGIHWDIYVSNDELTRDLAPGTRIQISDIRYGSWSLERGLKRGPIYPSEDFLRMEAMGAVVYEHLLALHDKLPFEPKDCYEYWLLDIEGQPLALLHSALTESETWQEQPALWRAGLAARATFFSEAMPQACTDEGQSAADRLTCYVNACAGEPPSTQWFRREADGSGIGLAGGNLSELFVGRRLAGAAFPALLLAESGHEALYERLVADYLAWQAPWLLLLAGLTADTRQGLERQARSQAETVERQHRLYPAVVDAAFIQAARVEAMLCRSQAAQEEPADTPPYYIELNPAGGNYT